jgi:hypothetical protein
MPPRTDYLRLLSELHADLPTKLFANAKRVRLAAAERQDTLTAWLTLL